MAEEPSARASGSARAERNGRPPSLPGRILGGGARGARRVAGATGVDRALETVIEEAIVRAIESQPVERALDRVLRGPVIEEAVAAALESPAVERSLIEALDSEMVDRVWERLLASEETQKLVERIAGAPELRAAIATHAVGVFEDLARQVREVASKLDDALEWLARAILRRPRRAEPATQAGAVTRVVALALDAGILSAIFLIASGLFALAASVVVPDAAAVAIGGGAWLAGATLYLIAFWAVAGQTPGMRLMGIRLLAAGSAEIGLRRAVLRLIGLDLTLLTLGAGFLPVFFTARRRDLSDWLGGTELARVEAAGWEAGAGR